MGMAPPCSPPELNDDLTAEILLHVAPNEPACLFQASLTCKRWHRILSDPGFLRHYHAFHRCPPSLLGFFYNLDFPSPYSGFGFDYPAPFSRFIATMSVSPLPHADAAHDDRRRVSWALDCRHGRVLFAKAGSRGLAVWDPVADDWTDLPPPSIQYSSYSAAVLCDVAGCDHRDCRCGRFLVVCIGLSTGPTAYACVYSSEDRAWQAPVSDGTPSWSFHMRRPALIGDGIYCAVGGCYWNCILKYDLVERRFAKIDMPDNLYGRDPVLMQNDDGSLGVAGVRGSRLYLWSRRKWNNNPDDAAAARWVQRRVIKLGKLLPLDNKHCIKANVIGFAEGVGVFFMRTNAGVFMLDLKLRRVTKVTSTPSKKYANVVPFNSFFTPDSAS